LALLGAHHILHVSKVRVKLSEYKLQDPQELNRKVMEVKRRKEEN
jgi:hypothetical protein